MSEKKPDLVISDMMMGTLLSGFSLFTRMGEDPDLKDVPVVIVSGIVSERGLDFRPGLAEQLDGMGVKGYFDKPLDPDELLAKVREILGQGAHE